MLGAPVGLDYVLWRRGPLTMAPSQFGVFRVRSRTSATPNLQFHFQPPSLDRFGEALIVSPASPPASAICARPAAAPSIAWPRCRRPPSIRPNYLTTPEDKRIAAEAIRLTRRIAQARRWRVIEPRDGSPAPSSSARRSCGRRREIGPRSFIPWARHGWGRDDPRAVVDAAELRGMEGLRVVDASVMPAITSGNTLAHHMIAEKAGGDDPGGCGAA